MFYQTAPEAWAVRVLRWVLGVLVALFLGVCFVIPAVVGHFAAVEASFLIIGDTEFSRPELRVKRRTEPGLPAVPP